MLVQVCTKQYIFIYHVKVILLTVTFCIILYVATLTESVDIDGFPGVEHQYFFLE